MRAVPDWCTNRGVLRGLGLTLETVRRFGQMARWIRCRGCGQGLIAVSCTDCGWSLDAYLVAYAHLAGLRELEPLYLFRCPSGCNTALLEHPTTLLVAQAQAAAVQSVARPTQRVGKARLTS